MHSPEQVFEELEADRLARESEIRLIERLMETSLAEREQEMLRQLEAKKAQRQPGREEVISVQEFAVRTGDHFLASYTPTYQRDSRAVSKFDKLMLKQRGIDPESVTCQGAVNLVCRAINIRRARGLAEVPLCQRLIRLGWSDERAYGVSVQEAKRALRRFELRTAPK